ncbi:MAG: 16S rRNA (uracil(1498)-N(3))-methyltransferase [Deltaproteobacteria bacterium]|nr:16S rRNA (uracil(1498)-N(3))-methyltransferase [Deltaproteobacteria bacterium]
MARFFVPKKNIQQNRGFIDGQELQHLRRVLRLTPGDEITIFDDAGWEHDAVIRSFDSGSAKIEILRSSHAPRESELELTLAIGLTKGDKVDFVVEKATELGVCRIVPIASVHTVAKFDTAKAKTRAARWHKIALSAAKQSGRTRVPEVLSPVELHDFIEQNPGDALKLLFWEKRPSESLKRVHTAQPAAPAIIAVIGPEGGFSDEEVALATAHGYYAVSLGRRILRAETAAVTALALMQYLWGDLGRQFDGADG